MKTFSDALVEFMQAQTALEQARMLYHHSTHDGGVLRAEIRFIEARSAIDKFFMRDDDTNG